MKAAAEKKLYYLGFAYLLSDALIVYLAQGLLSVTPVAINLLAPVFLLLAVVAYGVEKALPTPLYLVALLVICSSLAVGTFIRTGELLVSISNPSGIAWAFLLGFGFTYNVVGRRSAMYLIWCVSGLYAIVCAIALSGIAPSAFPVIELPKIIGGEVRTRFEVMTDPNFQIMYLVSGAALLTVARKRWEIIALVFQAILSLYVLSQLQTRSGFLIYLVVMAFAIVVLSRRLSPTKRLGALVVGGGVVVAAGVAFSGLLFVIFEEILLRFLVDDLDTFSARLEGVRFFFVEIINPAMWIPVQPGVFAEKFGVEPHFNPAMLLLRGGILAVVSLLILQIFPIVRHCWKTFFDAEADEFGAAIALTAAGVLVASLSVPAVVTDQVWLWAGASVGWLTRSKRSGATENYDDQVGRTPPGTIPVDRPLRP